MKITTKDTNKSDNGSTYQTVLIETGKTKYSILLVSGKFNYVSVRKHVPGSLLGKRFDSFADAQANYSSALVKTILLMAEEALTPRTKYAVHVEDMDSGRAIKGGQFAAKADANKFKRTLKKQFDLISHAGHVVNYKKSFELFTNY